MRSSKTKEHRVNVDALGSLSIHGRDMSRPAIAALPCLERTKALEPQIR
jgi:hypothetical protein